MVSGIVYELNSCQDLLAFQYSEVEPTSSEAWEKLGAEVPDQNEAGKIFAKKRNGTRTTNQLLQKIDVNYVLHGVDLHELDFDQLIL